MSAEQGDVEIIREALDLVPDGYPGQFIGDEALAALDRLAAAMERVERLREGYYVDAQQQRERADKAERALAEMREALQRIANIGDPVPGTGISAAAQVIARAALRPSEEASDES